MKTIICFIMSLLLFLPVRVSAYQANHHGPIIQRIERLEARIHLWDCDWRQQAITTGESIGAGVAAVTSASVVTWITGTLCHPFAWVSTGGAGCIIAIVSTALAGRLAGAAIGESFGEWMCEAPPADIPDNLF